MKRCSACEDVKPLSDFNKRKRYPDGHDYKCRDCNQAYMAEYREKNRSRIQALQADWEKRNPDKVNASRARTREVHAERLRQQQLQWRKDNPERSAEIKRKYRMDNAGKVNARTAKRRADLLNRTSLLRPDDLEKIKALYGFAKWMTERFGQPYHVDHIVPLRGKTCSGLHVPSNLRVVPAQLNLSKGAKIDYELTPHAFKPDDI